VKPDKKMDLKCKHCSERERAAMDAERAGNKYKQVEYMQGFLGEEFEGVISGVAAFGFWVETVEHKCEGLVSINSLLEYDEFRLIDTDYSLVGMRSGRKFRMGDKVTIKVVAANLVKRQLDYEWVLTSTLDENGEEVIKPKHKPRPKQKHKKKKQEEYCIHLKISRSYLPTVLPLNIFPPIPLVCMNPTGIF
jgi:ribonuclease R